ncbi:LacI family DNA-binding transcriptional regulator [Marinitenerispora sediminis]|uniref:LacI family transcriptional regulator n=1 Tax=Marinitenerispora sediminis TaxID=1931232 RepID=A0A368TC02_9ACTN|nr:LacI family DNA-binding transcriptional regulator [Marinitenerispora sediminis]RCV50103.1 LacI family transcriptional regulator [Marinitenerispora sediminis]RCV54472.1 LacI family transcriptional regulator [Marinitenerispora sediminis]RCV62506.1 LacI family transcriptional regulator [Marinitenerispora sediminis]
MSGEVPDGSGHAAAGRPAPEGGGSGEAGPWPRPARPAKLADIAREAGVHVTTASRALRGSEGVGPETAARVREVAQRLGYLPHPAAASLRTGRSKLLGVVVPRLTDLVLATIYEGIEQGAASAGYQAVVANSGDDREAQRLRVATLLANRVDGLILGDARTDSPLVHELRRRGTKIVLTSRRLPGVVSVTCDDVLGGRMAAEHLVGLGHRDVGVIAGEPYASTGIERTRGFVTALADAGLPVPDANVLRSGFDVRGGREAAEELLARTPRPTALFAVNDFAAIGAMGAIRDAGLRVGDDVAVVGFNDVPLAAELPVALTTVRSPMREMGRQAALALVALIAGEHVESLRMRPELMARASTLGTRG